ncbi:hypothetical protein FACS1894208_04980 [Clostridia bacterium]|nr:hypothetical protein FACS1894208_04980 [Clostridia bacterium]
MKKDLNTVPFLSIIVPCYKVEEYLPQCLDSIAIQTFADFEVIAVNDGSPDGTLDILREFEARDPRFKVVDKPNGGYGAAVNMGIAAATGKYIGIVESDDFIHASMYKTLVDLSVDGTVDIVKGNFYNFYDFDEDTPKISIDKGRKELPDEIAKPFVATQYPSIFQGHPSIWSAIYRADFLKDIGIAFEEAKGGGWVDNPFFFETVCRARSITWTAKPLYFYRKTNPNSSSNSIPDLSMPLVRMIDNLDVLEKNNYTDRQTLRYSYQRAMMHLHTALRDKDLGLQFDIVNTYANQLMQRLDPDVVSSDFKLRDQYDYHRFSSPLKIMSDNHPKVLIYNWLPFDNPWNFGGGVNIYCRNLVDTLLQERPDATVYFLSSGFAYVGNTTEIFYRKLENVFGDRCRSFEIVNSPVPADQRNLYINPLVALENPELKDVFAKFFETYGEFEAVHFNNIEGLSLDVFDLKREYPKTKFLFSIHNYNHLCLTGSYFQRHNHCNCNPEHTAEDCMKCSRVDIKQNIELETYNRGKFGQDIKNVLSLKRWSKAFGFDRLDQAVDVDAILTFAQTATEKINENCDHILAVSKRVRDIAIENGSAKEKTVVSYIGTVVAKKQVGRSLAALPDKGMRFKIVFLGSDINYEEKGYPFLLDSLEQLDAEQAAQIDVVLTVKSPEHSEIYTMLKHFHSVKVINGYSHDDLPNILSGVHLGVVPVLWEDNLPQIAIEMVAHGVPVLSSDAGGASELSGSKLFKFKSGDTDDFLSKLTYFLKTPEALDEYWVHHSGLMTMKQHWQELAGYYGLSAAPKEIAFSLKDFGFLLREHDFLQKYVSLDETIFAPDPVREKLRKAFEEAKIKLEQLENEKKEMDLMRGKVIFEAKHTPFQNDSGASLFKISVEKIDGYSFYAEVKFMLLKNDGPLTGDTLRISGTCHGKEGAFTLKLHQLDWEDPRRGFSKYIHFYIRENTVYAFGQYPGQHDGIAYEVMTLVSRDNGIPQVEPINSGLLGKNEKLPGNAFNSLEAMWKLRKKSNKSEMFGGVTV